jgi:hypothetical protein
MLCQGEKIVLITFMKTIKGAGMVASVKVSEQYPELFHYTI